MKSIFLMLFKFFGCCFPDGCYTTDLKIGNVIKLSVAKLTFAKIKSLIKFSGLL